MPKKIKTEEMPAREADKVRITDTIEQNFMPYAMSVIVSRAIPEIDGLKPAHRKLLYTMYIKGLLGGNRTKCANIVGETMKLNPHGESSIYETLVRLSRGNQTLLIPLIDSKGNFGKCYSRDMAYAASRYTEAKLEPICAEMFKDIDKDAVDFTDNYDGTMKEPVLLPSAFPNILVNPNTGIAVGMASNICSFNLSEIIDAAVNRINDPDYDLMQSIKAPDFSTGGFVLYNEQEFRNIIEAGRGSFKIRSKYSYNKKENIIDVLEIPYTTTIEAIVDKITELVKTNKIKDIVDVKDESDKNGLKISIYLRRGVDPDNLMKMLFKMTPLEDTFACNFNILIAGSPRVMGVGEILDEWTAFRSECIKRQTFFDLNKKKQRLHLLKGLKKILLDIDKAIKIIRETESEAEVIPNLMIGFQIDKIQAEHVAEIKLRNLNKEYILKRVEEISTLVEEIADLEDILNSPKRVKKIIINQLKEIDKKYQKPRITGILYEDEVEHYVENNEVEDYAVNIFATKEGYFKKITPLSLRMGGEHKLKEGDRIVYSLETKNTAHLLFFTNKNQVYKAKVYEFEDTKASVLGDYVPTKLSMDPDENVVCVVCTEDYKGYMLFGFKNGKIAKVNLESYQTKTNRKKLINAYSDKAELAKAICIREDCYIVCRSSNEKILIVNTKFISEKGAKDSRGVNVMTQKAKSYLCDLEVMDDSFANPHFYMTKTLPAAGKLLNKEDAKKNQLSLF